MKKNSFIVLLAFLFMGFTPPKSRILIIGDSISIGYFPFVKETMSGKAVLVHNAGNAQNTGTGLKKIREWIGNEKWDIIQFNWGLWDLTHRNPTPGNPMRLDKKGKVTFTPEEYGRNLDSLVKILKSTHAKLIFVTTTYVPEDEPGRFTADPKKYNKVAMKIMKANGVQVNDIYAASKKIHSRYGKGDNNVHYKPEGYKLLAERITRFLEKQLR
jgi:lysophospholipase L1-like esterase